MKTVKIKILSIILAGTLLLPSCEDGFLTQDPQTSLSTDQVFESLDNVQPYLDGLYFKWRSSRVNRKGFIMMLGTDEAQQGEYQVQTDATQAGMDKYNGFYEPQNTVIAELWNVRWPVVVQATEALNTLNRKLESASEADITRIRSFKGQASFYRGAVLLELAQAWGRLPIPTVVGSKVELSGRKPLTEVYTEIENSLKDAGSLLGIKADASNVRIPTRWAAKVLLAKLYMSADPESGFRDFGKAQTLLEEVKSNGGFSLVRTFGDLWDPEKTAGNEAVYTFYFNNIWPDTNELQWYAGTRACSSDPNCYLGGYDLILPTEYCYSDASANGLWETGDVRKDESIRYNFVYNGKQPSAMAGFGDDQLKPHIKKYEDKRIDGTKTFYNTGKNVYYLRYADVLLMLAECMNETGNTSGAVTLVNNEIRNRAWNYNLPEQYKWDTGMSPEEFRTKIMDERMRELCFEGWRRFDLIRTGHFVDYISAKNRWAKAEGTIKKEHALYPIPLVEMKQNPNITEADQNPGY
ncbi:RagB/SusD family nutrient uptake outer membrane protein [Barnesiella propionica]|uniref:RagB/SusD family nutrient uptake outer membrane protein n=1 Tax=Barnesiella propionica TaxID=2981781 RepID=UPI0011CAB0E1|nr:RagB/SusD family nutrient uptake outer membrane protein [Barnesiella propionica]MCU6769704.1 RagB/SusD family nutrient uptake outer membrane protein [Barnesiella propionica]